MHGTVIDDLCEYVYIGGGWGCYPLSTGAA